MDQLTEHINPRRGIRPFEKGLVTSEVGELRSPNLNLGALGKAEVHLYDPIEDGLIPEYAYYFDGENISVDNEENLSKKGYRQLVVYLEPVGKGSLPEMESEIQKKGELDSLIWMNEKSIMRAAMLREVGNTVALSFMPDGTDKETLPLYVSNDEELLKKLQISFERPIDIGGEN